MCGQNLVSQWVVKKVPSPDFPLSSFYTHIIHSHTKEKHPININTVSVFCWAGWKNPSLFWGSQEKSLWSGHVSLVPGAHWQLETLPTDLPQQRGQTSLSRRWGKRWERMLGREVGSCLWHPTFFYTKTLEICFFFSFISMNFPSFRCDETGKIVGGGGKS